MSSKKFRSKLFDTTTPFHKTFFEDDSGSVSRDEYDDLIVVNDKEACETLNNEWSKIGDYISRGVYGRVFHFGEDAVVKFQVLNEVDYSSLMSFDTFSQLYDLNDEGTSDKSTVLKKYSKRFGVGDKYPEFGYHRLNVENVADYGDVPSVIEPYDGIVPEIKCTPENTFYFRNTQNSEYAINHILLSKYGPEMGIGIVDSSISFSSCFAPTYNVMFCKNISMDGQTGYFSVMEKINGPTLDNLWDHLSTTHVHLSETGLRAKFDSIVDTCILGILATLGCFQAEFGFMHNDLKVDNILVRKIGSDSVFLTDMGNNVLPNAVSDWGFDFPGGRVCTSNEGYIPAIIDFGLSCMFRDNISPDSSLKVNVFNDTIMSGRTKTYAPNYFNPCHDILFLLADIYAFDTPMLYLNRYFQNKTKSGDAKYPPITRNDIFKVNDPDYILKRRTLHRNKTILKLVELAYLPMIEGLANSDKPLRSLKEYIDNDPYLDSDDKLIVMMCSHFSYRKTFVQSRASTGRYIRVDTSDYFLFPVGADPTTCLRALKNRFECDDDHENSVTLARFSFEIHDR
jgi:serine/threonine protein kinase